MELSSDYRPAFVYGGVLIKKSLTEQYRIELDHVEHMYICIADRSRYDDNPRNTVNTGDAIFMSQSPKHTHRVVRKAELAKFRSDMTTFEQAYEDVGNRLDTASKKLVRDMLAVTESELAAVKSNASV